MYQQLVKETSVFQMFTKKGASRGIALAAARVLSGCRIELTRWTVPRFPLCTLSDVLKFVVVLCRYLNDIWSRYERPIWLTELACPNENGTLSRQVSFMRNALKLLDEDDSVERCDISSHSWWSGSFDDVLLSKD